MTNNPSRRSEIMRLKQQLALCQIGLSVALLAGCAAQPLAGTQPSDCCRTAGGVISTTRSLGSVSDIDATWETDSGNKVKLNELNGRVRVISMFYSTCQGVCVITKQDMQDIDASLSPAARQRVGFVLVTLDANRDTAEALRTYRHTESLPSDRWTLLRGDDAATSRLASLLGIASGRDASGRFVHSSQLIVLDQNGRIILRYGGLRADLNKIAREVEVAALAKPAP
jgi:protein SCO1/2